MESDSESEQGPSTPKRRNYDLNFKLDVVDYAEKHDNSKAARHFKVGRTQVINWIAQKADLQKQM